MTNPEQSFTQELDVFRTEAQAGAQYLYGYLALNVLLAEKKKALDAINQTPLFSKTNIGALQTAFFVVLGPIFDQQSKHNRPLTKNRTKRHRHILKGRLSRAKETRQF